MGDNFTSCVNQPQCVNVWARRLTDGNYAILFANVGKENATQVGCSASLLMQATGWINTQKIVVSDLWDASVSDRNITAGDGLALKDDLPQDSGLAMYLLQPYF